MLTLVIIFAIVVFCLAFFSPRLSKKVEYKAKHHTFHLKRRSNSLWTPLTLISHSVLELFKRMTTWSARNGRRVRRKAERDDT